MNIWSLRINCWRAVMLCSSCSAWVTPSLPVKSLRSAQYGSQCEELSAQLISEKSVHSVISRDLKRQHMINCCSDWIISLTCPYFRNTCIVLIPLLYLLAQNDDGRHTEWKQPPGASREPDGLWEDSVSIDHVIFLVLQFKKKSFLFCICTLISRQGHRKNTVQAMAVVKLYLSSQVINTI